MMIPLRFLRGESTTTYASSKLNRVGRRAARYDSGLSAHRCNRPAHKRPAPHRIAHERIACSRSRCGNFTPSTELFTTPVNPWQHRSSLPSAPLAQSPEHNHARYDPFNRLVGSNQNSGAAIYSYVYDRFGNRWQQNGPHTMIEAFTGNSSVNNNRMDGYAYDAAGNLLSDGTNFYTYDAENRIVEVQQGSATGPVLATYAYGADGQRVHGTGVTSDTYDNVGNLASVTYPDTVVHNYTYDTRNRLTNLGVKGSVSGSPGAIASYAYTLDASGHRLSVAELSGRSVTYAYDNLYRLTSETIASDPHSINGAVSYTYDPVGNRTQKTSTLPGFPGGTLNYDTNDQLTTDAYDANGNTTTSNSLAYTYDFENHLIQQAGISVVYDGDGNRASKTVSGITSTYLIDTQNPTGYVQVLQESFTGNTGANFESMHTYVYGLERISERRNYVANNQGATANAYYVYDGHGSVRALADPTGTVTDTYDYDAFGNLIHSTGTTPNNYLFAGEQFDPDLGLYYNRARYLHTSTGRFLSMDTAEPTPADPASLHRYLYADADPVNGLDPTGLYTQAYGYEVEGIVQDAYIADFGGGPGLSLGGWARVGNPSRSAPYSLKPDILDWRRMIWMEVKPLSLGGVARASAAWGIYTAAFAPLGISPDVGWLAGGRIFPSSQGQVLVFNTAGILFYTTSQQDYRNFEEIIQVTFGLGAAAAGGALAGQLVNTLVGNLPVVPVSPAAGSEIIDIGNKARIAIQGTEAGTETEVGLDLAA